jgi:hypothetical protein
MWQQSNHFLLDNSLKSANICSGLSSLLAGDSNEKLEMGGRKINSPAAATDNVPQYEVSVPGGRSARRNTMSTTSIPYIDPNVQHVGVSRLRSLNATQLREIDKTLVIQENDQPLAVLLKYEEFLIMQQKLMSVLDTISVMADDTELAGIMAGLKEMTVGNTKSIAEIRAGLKTKKEKA